jgi:hypothetical protein
MTSARMIGVPARFGHHFNASAIFERFAEKAAMDSEM